MKDFHLSARNFFAAPEEADLDQIRYYGLRYLLSFILICSLIATINNTFFIGEASNAIRVSIPLALITLVGLKIMPSVKLEYTVGLVFSLMYIGVYSAGYSQLVDITIVLLVLNMFLFLFIFFINNKVLVSLIYILCVVANLFLFDSTLVMFQYLMFALTFLFYLNSIRDLLIKSRKNIKEESKSYESKNKEIQLFSQIMTHDIKTPLHNIAGICRLLRRDIVNGKINSTHHKMIKHVVTCVEMAQDLVDSLIEKYKEDFSEESFKTLNLENIIHETATKLKYQIDQTNTDIRICKLGEVMGDERALKTLFYNLIGNAIKYQPKDIPHRPLIKISHTVLDDNHLITIKDNGIGIEGTEVNKIFEPFERLHGKSQYTGSGLGLYLCKSIVEKHKGTITASSEVGFGTNISISIPRRFAAS